MISGGIEVEIRVILKARIGDDPSQRQAVNGGKIASKQQFKIEVKATQCLLVLNLQ